MGHAESCYVSPDDVMVRRQKERREQIPCYALRSAWGLRISSNRVEKANDMVVSRRKKNNGMSWSETGSGAPAHSA